MQNVLKAYFGIALAIVMAFQGIAVQHFSEARFTDGITETDNIAFSRTSIEDYTSKLPIIYVGERFLSAFHKTYFSWGDILPSHSFLYLFHFENEIKNQILLCQRVDLFFGIRELKFPTHYFW